MCGDHFPGQQGQACKHRQGQVAGSGFPTLSKPINHRPDTASEATLNRNTLLLLRTATTHAIASAMTWEANTWK